MRFYIDEVQRRWASTRQEQEGVLQLQGRNVEGRLERLTDALVDGLLDKASFESRKQSLWEERRRVAQDLAALRTVSADQIAHRVSTILELAGTASLAYKCAEPSEKADLIKSLTSNRQVDGKKLELTLLSPFDRLEKCSENRNGAPYRGRPRTLQLVVRELWKQYASGRGPDVPTIGEMTAA